MAIEFNCPHCGAFYRLDEKFAGKMGKCKNPKCKQSILIPFQSTVAATPSAANKKVDAEALAAAAFGEEAPLPAAVKETPAAKKIPINCQHCDHKFEVDATMAGKNTTCPECRKIIRVPKLVEDKPSDWRSATGGRPSMAKATEPVPAGVWETTRKGVSGEALRKAGALETEDDEDPRERRLRRIKRAMYALAFVGIAAMLVRYVLKERGESHEGKWMDMAVKAIEDKNEGVKSPEFQAAIHRYAGEYHLRIAKKIEDRDAGLKYFDKARDELQNLPTTNPNRSALLGELAANLVVCGGNAKEVADDTRVKWQDVRALTRKCLDKIPPADSEMRSRAVRLMTRRFAEKDQAALASEIAKNSAANDEAELVGLVGVELFLMGKKDDADKVLNSLSKLDQPAATALWLALHPDADQPPSSLTPMPMVELKSPKPLGRGSRLAYAEGYALQGKSSRAIDIAKFAGPSVDRIEALARIASIGVEQGKMDEALAALEKAQEIVKIEGKAPVAAAWSISRLAEIAFRAGKPEQAEELMESIKDDGIKSWARLEILRMRLAALGKAKADEAWLEQLPPTEKPNVAQALQRAEMARHNAAAGESSYIRSVQAMPKGTIQPFGFAGTALGLQDRKTKTR